MPAFTMTSSSHPATPARLSSGPAAPPNMVIRQDPFSVTLDAWAMLVAALLLLAGMHFLQHTLLETLVLAVPVALLVRNDYHNFLLLGPGGTPPTFRGYLRLLWFQLFALRDVYHINPSAVGFSRPERRQAAQPSSLAPSSTLSTAFLAVSSSSPFSFPSSPSSSPPLAPTRGVLATDDLPYRPGPRPRVAGLAPQRQLDQPASPACHRQLRAAAEALARRFPHRLSTGTSCQEKHGFGLFARHPVHVWAGQGEVFHIHDTDKSMHMSLHPNDIKEILDKGWGERHPLAFSAAWVRAPVAPTFVLIYAPRDECDLAIVARIVEAAIWHTTGEKLVLDLAAADTQAV